MSLNTVLDRKLESFIKNHIDKTTVVALCSSMVPNPERVIENIVEFTDDVTREDHKIYLLRKILDYLDSILFTKELVTAYTSYSESARARFDENIALVQGEVVLMLHDLNYKLDDEIFTNEEFDSLKVQISDIADNLFELQKRQEAANELIYNSVEELKEELIRNAKKGRVFGKEFVQEQLAGKIMDIALKGGALGVISTFSHENVEISSFVKSLL